MVKVGPNLCQVKIEGLCNYLMVKVVVGVSRPGGPWADEWVSPRAPAQIGRARRRARRGESEAAGDQRERGGNPATFVFVPRPGRVRLQ
jgi:hypothetical protein